MEKEQYGVLTPKFAVLLANPRSWVASALPALFAEIYCVLSGFALDPVRAIALLIACVLMQSSVNTLNDFFDYVKGTDSRDDCLEESDALLIYENLKPSHVFALGVCYLIVAGLFGLWAIYAKGMAPLVIGIIGAAVVLLYSGGPVPISYLPVGELFSGAVMGGLIPLGVVAAVTGTVHWRVLLFSAPFILGIALIMMSNNGCDIEKDRKAGRRTLPVLLGREKTVRLYRVLTAAWLVLLWVLPILLIGPWGLLSAVLLHVIARPVFGYLMCSPLIQARRVEQIKGIVEANLKGNGVYIFTLLAGVVLKAVNHG